MPTSNSNGSQTATVTTEHIIGNGGAAITDVATFVLGVDTSNMALIDELILRVYVKVRSTGTTRLVYSASYAHVQSIPVKLSIPVPSTNEIKFTLEQTAGTGRAFPWEIWEL